MAEINGPQTPKPIDIYEQDGLSPGFVESLDEAFAIHNEIGAAIRYGLHAQGPVDQKFDPFAEAEKRGIPESQWEPFYNVVNPNQFDRVSTQLEDENKAREALDSAGTAGLSASILAGMLSPTNIIGSSWKAPIKAALASSVAQESLLNSLQVSRTSEESALNVGTSVITAGVLGKLSEVMTPSEVKKAYSASAKYFDDKSSTFFSTIGYVPWTERQKGGKLARESADDMSALPEGADAPFEETGKGFVGGKKFQAYTKMTSFLHPSIRMAQSDNDGIRSVAEDLLDLPLLRSKDRANRYSVETAVNTHQAYVGDALYKNRKVYKDYVRAERAQGRSPMKVGEFNEEVTKDMFRGHVSENEYIRRASENSRKGLFDPEKENAIKAGLLDEDVKPSRDPAYMFREWNRNKIVAEEGRFRSIIKDWATETMNDIAVQARKLIDEGTAAKADIDEAARNLKSITNNPDKFVNDILDNVVEHIKGIDQGGSLRSTYRIDTSGPLRGRTLDIESEKVFDFLNLDMEDLSKKFVKKIAPEIELTNKFGTANFADVRKKLLAEHTEKKKAIKDPQKALEFENNFKRDIGDLEALWDIVRGTYRPDNVAHDSVVRRIANAAMSLNYMRLLGGVLISSLTDVATPVLVHGFDRTFRTGLKPFVRAMHDKEFHVLYKRSTRDARRAGLICEKVLADRSATLWGMDSIGLGGSGIERAIAKTEHLFSKYTGILGWNDMLKAASSLVSHHRILDLVQQPSISEKDSNYLNVIGLGTDIRQEIADSFKKHGETIDGLYITNDHLWDPKVAKAYQLALVTDNQRTVLRPGKGDLPIFGSHLLGRLLLQFQSFTLAANTRILAAGLQEPDKRLAEAAVSMITMGMFVEYLKNVEAGRDQPNTPLDWVRAGVDRSGIATIPMFVHNNFLEPAGLGVSSLPGFSERKYGFDSQRVAIGLLGPTAGAISDIAKTAHLLGATVGPEEVRSSDLNGLRRLLPFNNALVFRTIFDNITGGRT